MTSFTHLRFYITRAYQTVRMDFVHQTRLHARVVTKHAFENDLLEKVPSFDTF